MRVHSLVEYSIQREDKMKPLKRTNPDYNKYIKSKDWYSKHPGWLKDVGYRCGLFPWVRIGNEKRYACHHTNYRNLGNERLRKDVIPLCPFAHDFVIHGILSGFKSAGKQGGYPNLSQRLVHLWCCQRAWFKVALVVEIVILSFKHHLPFKL